MKVFTFLAEAAVVDWIIRCLELRFMAEKPLPAHVFEPVALMTAEESHKLLIRKWWAIQDLNL